MGPNGSKINNDKQAHTRKEVSTVHLYFTGRREENRQILQTTQSLSKDKMQACDLQNMEE
jgi:hypothetical protein